MAGQVGLHHGQIPLEPSKLVQVFCSSMAQVTSVGSMGWPASSVPIVRGTSWQQGWIMAEEVGLHHGRIPLEHL